MYHPYFRGKQYELITIRETAGILASSGFVPIIEPVREALSGLSKALEAIFEAEGNAIVVVNPDYGDHSNSGAEITALLQNEFVQRKPIAAGILLKSSMTVDDALALYDQHVDHNPALIHAGFSDGKALAESLKSRNKPAKHVFIENSCGKLYRRHFAEAPERVLIRDGFNKKKNALYEPVEHFSDLHLTYSEEAATGFGDFLIVGDDFVEGGGPAYAVAIHLTFIDPTQDETMNVYHFVSTDKDTPTDAPGKFKQALTKLIEKLDGGDSHLYESLAIEEFRLLHARGHFPGLGYVKKLSMNHHIESLSNYLS